MKITFLGTGTSQGVPIIGCKCDVCTSSDKKDNRLRTSVLIESSTTSIVIDTGPDFRYQMLRNKVHQLNAVLYTHGHKDHVAGLDDIRAFNYFQQRPIDVYADTTTQQTLQKEFTYIFDGTNYPGIPQIQLHTIKHNTPFSVNDICIEPFYVLHYKMQVMGFKINDFVYITDANFISDEVILKIKNCKVLVLNALRNEKHISHFTLNEALEVSATIGAQQTYFTHISHQLGKYQTVSEKLPPTCFLAYDGLVLE